jgi:Starch-binding associating with outer membrane
MKRYKYLLLALIPATMAVSCKKSAFVKDNINPSTLVTVDPSAQFLYAADQLPNSAEYYYDIYRFIMPWMQYITNNGGNPAGFNLESGNFGQRYGNYYQHVGLALADIPHLIAAMPAAEQAAYQYEAAIAAIYMAYYTFYVSDTYGSIPYSQAFQARYGGTLTPTYDPQQTLFDTLDLQIKTAVATLESSPSTTQKLYGANDPFFGGASNQVTAWLKAANALRMKIAMRLIKRDAATATTIVTEALADANQMSAIGDSWVLYVGPAFADAGGNFNPTGFLASEPMVNFFNKYNDPREPIYFRQVSGGGYVGGTTSPDSSLTTYWKNLYKASDTPISQLQHRLWTPNFNENDGFGPGTGVGFFPVITYAEYCFMRAELGARAITNDAAATWYTNGVTASIQFYDARATAATITGYVPVTATQISNYLAQPDIAFDPTRSLDQIDCQAYIDFFKNPAEAWAWWKRTGFPNTTSVLPWTAMTSGTVAVQIPRRQSISPLPASDANYANQQAAFTQMATDPNWGATPDNEFGRVWWDLP